MPEVNANLGRSGTLMSRPKDSGITCWEVNASGRL